MILISVFLLLLGLAAVIIGADKLVEGATSIARRLRVNEFIIGLTVVGIGTSAPEFVVSTVGAISGSGDIAIGNVLGSNIFNTLLILGVTSLILPLGITAQNRRNDIPMNIMMTLLFILLCLDRSVLGVNFGGISQIEGAILLLAFWAYIWITVRDSKPATEAVSEPGAESLDEDLPLPVGKSIFLVVAGLVALVAGGKVFVDAAVDIARALGLSDKFIAVTILAGGTSLPELATCVAAAIKKKGQLALGNIVGSNIFNLLLIIGTAALISPMSIHGVSLVDMGVLLLSSIMLYTSCFIGKKNTIDRLDGAIFLLVWIAYMVYLIINL